MSELLIYGANGYTGALIARELLRLGVGPILAGRNREAIASLADELGLAKRVFELDHPGSVAKQLDGVRIVLNTAGPFSHTAVVLADACLRSRVHYLDITGEEAVFAALA